MTKYFLDTNIFIRFLVKDVKPQFEKSKAIFKAIEEEKFTASVSVLVINETVWILENFYEIPRRKYIPELTKILTLKNLKSVEMNKSDLFGILSGMVQEKLDFTDLYLISLAKKNDRIVSFDKDFDRLKKIKRVESF